MKHERSLLPALLLLACSSSEGSEPEAGPPRGPAGGIVEADPDSIPVTPRPNASGGGAGTAGVGDDEQGGASGAPGGEEFVSNPPGAELELVIVEGEPGLTLLNSNTRQRGVASTLVEWFAEVRNDGKSIACYPRAHIELLDAAGTIVWKSGELGSFADTKPYLVPEQTLGTVPCLAPGELGVFYSNELRDAPVLAESITRVKVELSSSSYPGAEAHPAPPVIANLTMKEFSPGAGYWLIEGDLTAKTDMELADLNVYLRDPVTGLVDAWRFVSRLEPLPEGETWHFQTNNSETGPYADMSPFVSWYFP